MPSALRAATFVQVAAATPSSTTAAVTVSYPAAQTAGDLNIVVVGWSSTAGTVQSVTDSAGNSYKLAVGPTLGSLQQSIYFASGIAGGSNAVTVNFSQSVPYPDVRVLEYRGVAALDAIAGASGSSSTSASGSAVTTSGNELIFGANTVSEMTTGAGSGFQSRIITGDVDIAEDQSGSAAGTYNATAPVSSGNWVMQMATFAPSPDAPPAINNVTSSSGSASGGTAVTISGAGFAGGATVRFGNAPATNVTVASTSQITATSPAGSGAVTVTVTNPDGQSASLAGGFTYTATTGTTGTTSTSGISFVQVAAATPSSPSSAVSVTYPAAETAGDFNVVVVGWNDNTANVKAVKDSAGNTYQRAVGPTAGTGMQQSIYYAAGIHGGTNTVTVSFDSAASYPDIRILEYRGGVKLDATAAASGTSTTASSGSATINSAGDLIFGANTVSDMTVGNGTGFTSRISTGDSDIAEDRTAGTTGSVSATASVSGGRWVMQMAAFAPSGTSAGTGTPSLNAMSCASSSETGSATDACTVSLTAAAPSGGVSVALSSSNSAVSIPASVTVPAGAASVGFSAAVSAVTTTQTATLTAVGGGGSKTYSLQLNAAAAALSTSASSLSFGNVTLNTAVKQTVTLKSSGTAALTISSGSVAGAGFTVSGASFPVTLNPGQSATLTVQFDPTAAGTVSGGLTIASNAASGGSTTIALSGTGVATAALSAVSCASASITGAGTDACTVQLTAAAPSGGLAVALASSSSSVSVPAGVTVAAGATSAGFTATAAAVSTASTATLTASAGGVTKTVALQLNPSTVTLTLSSTNIAFGTVALNSPSTQSVVLKSSGTSALTISAGSASGTGFSISGVSFPVTLNPGQSATLDVQFDPTTAGSASGTVTLTSNASSGSTAKIALSGTGQAASYSVDLSWSAPSSTSDPVTGYSVYREVSGGTSYQLLNSSAQSSTSYTDSTVQSGKSYNYYVVSVDASGNQSGPSNTYTVAIP